MSAKLNGGVLAPKSSAAAISANSSRPSTVTKMRSDVGSDEFEGEPCNQLITTGTSFDGDEKLVNV